MTYDPRNQAQRRAKVKPRSGGGNIPPDAIIGAALFGALLILLGIAIAGSDNPDPEEFVAFTPTPIPAPTYVNGAVMISGDTFYTIEDVAFSYAAGIGHENTESTLPACTEVEIGNQGDGEDLSLFVEGDVYWVYAYNQQNLSNGWLPLNKLIETRPETCPEEAPVAPAATVEATPES